MNIECVKLPPGSGLVALYRVESRSNPGTFHDVAFHPRLPAVRGGSDWWECTCPRFTWKDTCAHVVEVRRRWMQERRGAVSS